MWSRRNPNPATLNEAEGNIDNLFLPSLKDWAHSFFDTLLLRTEFWKNIQIAVIKIVISKQQLLAGILCSPTAGVSKKSNDFRIHLRNMFS